MSATASTESRESTSEEGLLLHLPKQADGASKQGSPGSQALPSDVSIDDVISTFFQKLPERHKLRPQIFDKQGRLCKPFEYLKPKLDAARAQQKREAAAAKQQSSSRLKNPIGANPSVSQATDAAVIQATTEGLRTPSQFQDCAISPTAYPRTQPMVLVETSRAKDPVSGAPDGYSVHDSSLPPVGTFSISGKRTVPALKTYGSRIQTTKPRAKNVRTAQNRADHDQSRWALRSGPLVRASECQQVVRYSPTPNITSQQQSYNEQALPIAQGETPPESNTSSSTLLGDFGRSQTIDTVVVDAEEQRQILAPPKSSQTESVIPLSSTRVKLLTSGVVHNKIQQPRPQQSNKCRKCGNKNSCSCKFGQQPEGILCSDSDCFKGWWGIEDLQKNCGIKLRDAQEISRKFNCWRCPPCTSKYRAANTTPKESGHPHIRKAVAIIPEEPTDPISDNGSWPEDADIREPLQALTGILQQYTGTSTMARNQLSQINPQTPVLDIPCVRDESLQAAGVAQNAILILRQLLDVPDGVLIRQKVTEAKLQDTTCSVWIRGVLSFLINEFVFHSGSPFEDATLWRTLLAKSKPPLTKFKSDTAFANKCEAGHSHDQAENLIHEYRVQIMKAFEISPEHPDIPQEFRERVSRRRQGFVEHLNFTMLSLVGGNSDAQSRHRKIASIASELNLKVFAYRGIFEEIRPQMKEPFDAQRHAEENPEPDFPDLEGHAILVTTMMGVRFKHPEKDWRICFPAKVKMWPLKETVRSHTALGLMPDLPFGKSLVQETRIIPQKRRAEELQ